MFQGSHPGRMEFVRLVEQNGGVLNGSTRFDFTIAQVKGFFARNFGAARSHLSVVGVFDAPSCSA